MLLALTLAPSRASQSLSRRADNRCLSQCNLAIERRFGTVPFGIRMKGSEAMASARVSAMRHDERQARRGRYPAGASKERDDAKEWFATLGMLVSSHSIALPKK